MQSSFLLLFLQFFSVLYNSCLFDPTSGKWLLPMDNSFFCGVKGETCQRKISMDTPKQTKRKSMTVSKEISMVTDQKAIQSNRSLTAQRN